MIIYFQSVSIFENFLRVTFIVLKEVQESPSIYSTQISVTL